ncbi:MAG: hypothetical protein JWO94_3349, partial [Verrucomicrobiaceae bacterium]|nr:hypothetical protein [Verrucomicrobiaceae bacterium]
AATPPPSAVPPAAPAAVKPPAGVPAPPRPVVVAVPVKKFKAPAGTEIISKVKRVHPRLLMSAEGFAALKGRVETDPTSKTLLANISKTVDDLMALPELTKIYGAEAAAAAPGREGLFRLAHLGEMQYVKADPRMADRAVKEMLALSKDFTSWNPDKPDICSEFVWGIALGYDWFRPAMNADQAKTVRTALINFGIEALIATLKGEPVPAVSQRAEAGQTKTGPAAKGAPPKGGPAKPPAKKKEDKDEPVTTDHMKAACALMLASIAIADEEPNAAAAASNIGAKYFARGLTQFAPDGIWTETIEKGDEVLDMVASVIMTMRAACGTDFGFTTVEGLPNAGIARMYLTGPAGIFNYGDARGASLNRGWVTSWLAAMYGNPGLPALKVPGPVAPQRAGLLGQAGLLLYNSPFITGYGTPDSLDYAFYGADVATLRSAWNDPKALFVGLKGGNNGLPGAQLDLGTFVLDAGGVRWAVDLGAEGDRAPGMAKDDATKYKLYREGSKGQNILYFGEDQPTGARSNIAGFLSTPERGVAIVDLGKADSAKAKGHHRGMMMVRGPKPYILLQDEMSITKNASPEWVMHTRAEVTVDGGKATLKSGASLLTMTVLSPKGAKIVAQDAPELKEPEGSLKGVKVIKIALGSVKGEQTVTVAFALGDAAVDAAVVPLEQWVPKKK